MIKTNKGKIYSVSFTDPKEENKQSYGMNVYATCEEHARQIFKAIEPDAVITEVKDYDDCVSEHYDEGVKISEIELAQKVMYAIIDELKKDEEVDVEYADDVLDMAFSMTRWALHYVEVEANKKRKEESHD